MTINNNYKYSELTGKIIGCAMKVHNQLGNGYQELIYQRCLAIELTKEGIEHTREFDMAIYYDNHVVGIRRADFYVEGKVVIELKAVASLDDMHFAQLANYLQVSKLEIGLLINFGSRSLQFKRVINENKQE